LNINKTSAWQALAEHQCTLANLHMRDLFNGDPERFLRFSIETPQLFLDYSKNRITAETLHLLMALVTEARLTEHIDKMFQGEKINTTEQRAVLHTALRSRTIQFENLNYSAERLPKVWPSRFKPKGPLSPIDYAHNPQKLANEVYGGRMSNTGPNDGFTYRGRGLLQLTGKASYQEATTILRKENPTAPDFVSSPDEVISTEWCLTIAASEWVSKGCNALADQDDIRKITRAINGGQIGLAEPIEWAKRTKAVWR
jgi:putative chitinase